MRVVHVVSTLKGGGAETLVRELVPHLRTRGVDASIVTMYDAGLTPTELGQIGCEISDLHRQGRFDFKAPYRMWRILRLARPDIVHTHGWNGKFWGRACAIAAKVPIIVFTEHSASPRLHPFERVVSKILNPKTSAIVTFSQDTANLIKSRESVKRLVVIRNGITMDSPPPAANRAAARAALEVSNEILIGMVGSLRPVKNHKLALQAFKLLPEQVKRKTRLDIFGTGPLERSLRGMAAELQIGDRIRFQGFRSDIRNLMPGLDLLLSTSLEDAAPISYLEAMSECIPVIGTPTFGSLDIIEDAITGIVVKTWEARDVALALERAIIDDGWRVEAGKKARARLESEFDIEIVAERHAELYQSLLSDVC